MTSIAELGFAVNSDSAVKATTDLEKLTQASTQAEKAADALSDTAKDTAAGVGKIPPAAKGAEEQITKVGMSAKATAAAMRGVPAQFTDIVTSLQGGQAPLTVFLQQGGQLKDMFGGIGPAAQALGGYILGLVNPFTVAAGAAAVLAYGFEAGRRESEQYNKSIILTGGYAGVTADQLSTMARQVSAVVGTTGAAASALASLAGGGKIAGESFDEVAIAAIAMEQATGKAVGDTITEFNKIADDPVKAIRELDQQYHFLESSIYSQIVALKEQGNEAAAVTLATNAYADAIRTRTPEIIKNLGLVETAWQKIKNIGKDAVDNLLNVGRDKTTADKIDELRKRLTGSEGFDVGGVRMNMGAVSKSERAEIQAQINALTRVQSIEEAIGKQRGIDQQYNEKRNKAIDEWSARVTAAQTKQQKYDEFEKKTRADALLLGKSEVEVNNLLADAKAKIFGEEKKRASAVDLTGYNNAQNALKGLEASYQNSAKQLKAAQEAGILSQETYSGRIAALIRDESRDVTAAYQAEITALEEVKGRSTTTAEQRIQLDQKIADARSSMVRAQADSESQLKVLATLEEGRLAKQKAAVQAYVDQLERERMARSAAGDRAAAAVGMGDRRGALQSELDGVTDSFNKKRDDLLDRRRTAPDKYSKEDYERDLESLRAAEDAYRDTVVSNYDKISDAQSDWRNGATSALQNYMDEARNVAGQTRSLFDNAFTNMEDAIVEFATTGKLSFKDFADQIIKDLIRIQIRQAAVSFLSSAAGSGFAGLFGAAASASSGSQGVSGARALGGPVSSGSLYQVNEKGPELLTQGSNTYLMMGDQGGSITPLGSPSITANTPGVASMAGYSSPAPSASISVPIQVMGTADQKTLQLIEEAAKRGAVGGYQLVMKDLKRNGPARQMLRNG